MRDPLLAENPFLKDYSECEKWCYAFAKEYEDPVVEEFFNGAHPGWVALDVGVTNDGWLVPVLEGYHEMLENSLGYYDQFESDDDGCAASMIAVGPMEDDLKQQVLATFSEARAPYLLPVPGWLAAAPPKLAHFIPDGNFAVQGELGSGTDLANAWFWSYAPPPATDDPWQLYSPDGRLLSTGEPGEQWWQLYFEDFEERTGYSPDAPNLSVSEWAGMITGYDTETYESAFTYTYTGELLVNGWEDYEMPDPRTGATLCGPEIPLIHAAQQHVAARPPCGLGIGVKDPAGLDQSRIIVRGSSPLSGGNIYLNAGDITDPANPYKNQYEDFDRWLYDNHLRICRESGYNSFVGDDPWVAVEKVMGTIREAPGPAFQTAQFDLYFDDDGWLVPSRLQKELDLYWQTKDISDTARKVSARRYCNFYIQSCGDMPRGMYDDLTGIDYSIKAGCLPEIPAWLADNPPVSVRFLPGGGFITEGALGSLDNAVDVLPWVHYDAQGKELGSIAGEQYWWELTFPDFLKVFDSFGPDVEIDVDEWGGVIWFYQMADDTYLDPAIYNWKGEQLTNADPQEYALYFEPTPGEHLARMRAAQ